MLNTSNVLTLFLCGDVMVGRGLDQILPHPSDPAIHEDYIKTALGYVKLAENRNGAIPRRVDFNYVWGEALLELEQAKPHARIINLETSITTSDKWEDKGINYRMHPKNSALLSAAEIDVCALANNHILDWGQKGLLETLDTLHELGITTSGAGQSLEEAAAPAVVDRGVQGRVLVFSCATESSGVPPSWAAGERKAGIHFLKDLSEDVVEYLGARIRALKKNRDVVIVSIHWGSNWGYEIPETCVQFARALVDKAGVDIVHGHSSHHVKGIEVYHDRLIIYGCGDFLNDYEGIPGFEEFRGELSLMFFPDVEITSGKLLRLRLVPLHLKRFHLFKASHKEAEWIKNVLNREGQKWGTQFLLAPDGSLEMKW